MRRLCALMLVCGFAISGLASAQSTEQRFQDLFVTAGYSTAFGAALGAAYLGLTDNPTENLQYVAMGASLGFIGGSAIGTYLIFSPVFTGVDGGAAPDLYAAHTRSVVEPSLQVSPIISSTGSAPGDLFNGLLASWTVPL